MQFSEKTREDKGTELLAFHLAQTLLKKGKIKLYGRENNN